MNDLIPDTEKSLSVKKSIDRMSLHNGILLMIENQKNSLNCLEKVVKDIELVSELILARLKKSSSSRLIYCGAGTSARIGVQDGVELYPTFGWGKKRVDFIIAGGKKAVLESVENAEDDKYDAYKQVVDLGVSKNDVVIGLASSGNTPFTCEVIKIAKQKGAFTIGISNNQNGLINKLANEFILLKTGPEVVTGSTRLTAGTAQKICLNLISTLVMTHLGNVKDGYMINMVPSNLKLRKRIKRINKMIES
ncbi:N-acetylmuramic acid 6-phosphate etherase [Alphaproteobacteria bacterium]|nr:N-acetylmuramic acid 6-phosphate etherase [Alphaproteobacteria bacterium]